MDDRSPEPMTSPAATPAVEARPASGEAAPPPAVGGRRVFLLHLPAILASILMGAHFLRYFFLPLVLVGILMPLVFIIPRVWPVRVYQAWLAFGVVTWLGTINQLISERILAGKPYMRMVVILGAVVVFTIVGGVMLEAPALRRWRKQGFGVQ